MAIKVKRRPTLQHATIDQMRNFAENEAAANMIMARVDADAQSVASTMEKIHGGNWSVDIDHDDCFVLISRDFEPAP